jgi:hypothetical protein
LASIGQKLTKMKTPINFNYSFDGNPAEVIANMQLVLNELLQAGEVSSGHISIEIEEDWDRDDTEEERPIAFGYASGTYYYKTETKKKRTRTNKNGN